MIKKSGENGRLKGRFNGARVISTRFNSACFHHQIRSISSLEISKRFVEVKIDRGRIRVSFYRFKIFAIKKEMLPLWKQQQEYQETCYDTVC